MMRWRARASEIKATEPDPSVLVRGLTKISAKVVNLNQDLKFRLALARNSLLIDSAPTPETVSQYAVHLLAEMEQVVHTERKPTTSLTSKMETPKTKKIEEFKKQDRKVEEAGKETPKCKFYLTEEGCRRGRNCKWSHDQKDDVRRCYSCGSTKHLAPSCPTKETTSSPPKSAKASKKDEEAGGWTKVEKKGEEETEETKPKGDEDRMTALLEEANKMLKSINRLDASSNSCSTSSDDKLEELQRQLNQLKKESGTMKTLRLTKLKSVKAIQMGLLDSGATHPLRSLKIEDDVKEFQKVFVSLADGQKVPMPMTKSGVMISTDLEIEPIIPMGWLAKKCSITWRGEQMIVKHPVKGRIPVEVHGGCPHIEKELALQLIEEFEEAEEKEGLIRRVEVEKSRREEEWLRRLVECHPVFSELPDHIKSQLVLQPGEMKDLPVNRHARKHLKDGFVVHLYAGEKEGFTLQRAFAEHRLQKRLLEVDVKRGPNHNMIGESPTYAGLLGAALRGLVLAVVGGPNCRTRSVLRHYEPGPRPLRTWEYPFGIPSLTVQELEQVHQDDVMMWRMIFLHTVAAFGRRSVAPKEEVPFLLEHPLEPDYRPEVVSFWKTREWDRMKEYWSWKETAFCQGDFDVGREVPVKPTKVGGSPKIEVPQQKNPNAVSREKGPRKGSAELSRWVPGMMRSIAEALARHLKSDVEDYKLKAMTWQEHCRANHIPFRRDCRVCQEASAKNKPHRRVAHPLCGTLSVDTAGPLVRADDVEDQARFILIGAYTWLRPKRSVPVEEEPLLDEKEEHLAIEGEVDEEDDSGFEEPPEIEGLEEEILEVIQDEEQREEPEIEVFRLAVPLHSKKEKEILVAINQMYMQLRVHGYPILRLHSDLGGEFRGRSIKSWCRSRSIHRTTTAGDDSQANGRCERAVQEVKSWIRRSLLRADRGSELWPMACRYVNELERRRMADQMHRPIPPFGEKILVKRRWWKTQELESTHQKAIYLTPMPEAHGHMVMLEDGTKVLAPYFISKTKEPPEEEETWLALLREAEEHDPVEVRRRIRGKSSLRTIRARLNEEEEFEFHQDEQMKKVIAEEGFTIMFDEPEVREVIFEELCKMKKVEKEEPEEDVLRTRIVSPQEVLAEPEKWVPAIQAELDQMLVEKKALRKIDEEELRRMQKDTKKPPEVVPSKGVFTLKPGGPRRKARLVACGNYAQKEESESLYASGADALTLRFALKYGAEREWTSIILDIKVAFLNAPLNIEADDAPVVVLKPPRIFIKLGLLKEGEYFLAEKAVYGLRRSPRCWGLFRDGILGKMRTSRGLRFEPCYADTNLWQILEGDKKVGLLMVYVDDIMVLSTPNHAEDVVARIREEWETSTPEEVKEGVKTKFLGIEVTKTKEGFHTSQEDYIVDKLSEKFEGKEEEAFGTFAKRSGDAR